MDFNKIDRILISEPGFRQKQVKNLIWRDLTEDWETASTLPIALREKLKKECPLTIKAKVLTAKDGRSAKALITLDDGLPVETVLMKHQGRQTICVSSQIGCPLGCLFCATGQMGFKRNLTAEEIAEQILFWARYLKKENQKITNVVFMGMGEPFLNYDEVMAAIKILNDKDGLNIGSRHIAVSTVGIPEGIEKFAGEPLQVNLAISLHAATDKLRSQIVPINKKYPLKDVLRAAQQYIKKTNRKLMFEYIMIKDVNDLDQCACDLALLLKNFPRHLIMINLIRYNLTGQFSPSLPERVKKFKQILIDNGLQATERYHFGGDIKGACGQLAAAGRVQFKA